MNRRASCVGPFEVFEAAHVALRTLLAFSQPVNYIFWPIGMLNWLVAASKLHKHRETCCTAEWPFYSFLILWLRGGLHESGLSFNPKRHFKLIESRIERSRRTKISFRIETRFRFMYRQSYFSGDFSTYTLKYVNKLHILQTIFISAIMNEFHSRMKFRSKFT